MKSSKLPQNLKGHLWSATFEAFDFSTKVQRGLAGRHMKTKYLKLMPSKKALKTITYFSSERSNFLVPNDSKDDITSRWIILVFIWKFFWFWIWIEQSFQIFLRHGFQKLSDGNLFELESTKLIEEKIYLHPSHRYKKTE